MPAPISVDRKPVAAKTRLAMNFVVIAPIAPAKVIMPDWNGFNPKPICSISGIRKGMAPVEMRKTVPPTEAARKVAFWNMRKSRMGAGWRAAWRM
ncbi:hypothetical protein D3C72_977740 [compost metagenome]